MKTANNFQILNSPKQIKITIFFSRFFLFLFFLFLLSPALAYAKDLTFSLNQTEYYFLAGEEANIILGIENTYNSQISGLLSYTITQEVNQGGIHYSSTNTQSSSFSVEDGESSVGLNFGTSNNPATLKVHLSFSYDYNGQRTIDMDEITIYFVSDSSQKKEGGKKVESSSGKADEQSSQQIQQNHASSQMQQMQQQLNQLFGNQQQEPSAQQQLQNSLQNNQMAQDSSALKKQMEKQIQEQQQRMEEFQKQLSQKKEIQDANKELSELGYNPDNALFNPESENTGSFEINYKKENGEEASLKGQMKNSSITELSKFTSEDKKEMLEKLQNNSDFKELSDQIEKQGFILNDTKFEQRGNKTITNLNYQNMDNQTASIKAEFDNKNITKIKLEKNYKSSKKLYLLLLLFLIMAFLAYFFYRNYLMKTARRRELHRTVKEEPFDYVSEALKMLEYAKELFKQKSCKDAYGKAGQALRMFLSHKNNLNKEMTNDEIIKHLKSHKKPFSSAKECFDLCSLVEFAKYRPNKQDFEEIVKIAEKTIK